MQFSTPRASRLCHGYKVMTSFTTTLQQKSLETEATEANAPHLMLEKITTGEKTFCTEGC